MIGKNSYPISHPGAPITLAEVEDSVLLRDPLHHHIRMIEQDGEPLLSAPALGQVPGEDTVRKAIRVLVENAR